MFKLLKKLGAAVLRQHVDHESRPLSPLARSMEERALKIREEEAGALVEQIWGEGRKEVPGRGLFRKLMDDGYVLGEERWVHTLGTREQIEYVLNVLPRDSGYDTSRFVTLSTSFTDEFRTIKVDLCRVEPLRGHISIDDMGRVDSVKGVMSKLAQAWDRVKATDYGSGHTLDDERAGLDTIPGHMGDHPPAPPHR